MFSMSIKEVWIILQGKKRETNSWQKEQESNRVLVKAIHNLYIFLPVVCPKPVEWGVQLDDVGTEENIISNLRLELLL